MMVGLLTICGENEISKKVMAVVGKKEGIKLKGVDSTPLT